MALWWLSFCDGTRPEGQQFLGGCAVDAENIMHAVIVAHDLGLNPGGEVMGCEVPETIAGKVYPPEWRNRLLSKAELDARGDHLPIDEAAK